ATSIIVESPGCCLSDSRAFDRAAPWGCCASRPGVAAEAEAEAAKTFPQPGQRTDCMVARAFTFAAHCGHESVRTVMVSPAGVRQSTRPPGAASAAVVVA